MFQLDHRYFSLLRPWNSISFPLLYSCNKGTKLKYYWEELIKYLYVFRFFFETPVYIPTNFNVLKLKHSWSGIYKCYPSVHNLLHADRMQKRRYTILRTRGQEFVSRIKFWTMFGIVCFLNCFFLPTTTCKHGQMWYMSFVWMQF